MAVPIKIVGVLTRHDGTVESFDLAMAELDDTQSDQFRHMAAQLPAMLRDIADQFDEAIDDAAGGGT